eukprot:1082453-Alexandrium_andersonii.AAC.1
MDAPVSGRIGAALRVSTNRIASFRRCDGWRGAPSSDQSDRSVSAGNSGTGRVLARGDPREGPRGGP